MNRLLVTTAAFLLLASPAVTQPIGKASVAPEVQQRAQEQLQRQQSPQRDSGRGDGGRGDRGRDDRRGDRGPQAAPPQQQAAPQDRGRREGRDDRRGDRDGRDFRRDGDRDNRAFNRDRDYNRDGRTDYRRPGYGPRRDYSSFRDYHRGYNSSRRFRGPTYRRPAGWYDRRWTFGEVLPGLFWSSSYWLNDFDIYDLPPPPYGTVWVRNGSDALLIDRDSGEIISVRYGVFY